MKVDEVKLRQYLLKNLSDEETETIDVQFFENDELENAIIRAEEDLIEDYIDQTLSPSERKLFDANFLSSTRRRELLAFLTELKSEVEIAAPRQSEKPLSFFEKLAKLFRPNFPQIVAFASIVLVAAVFVWWLVGSGEPGGEIAALNKKDLSDLSIYQKSSNMNLTTDVLRGNSNSGKNLQKDLLTENVLVRLDLREDAAAIPVLEIFRNENLVEKLENVRVYKARTGSEIRLILPASKLATGNYRVEFTVENRKSVYNFKVQ